MDYRNAMIEIDYCECQSCTQIISIEYMDYREEYITESYKPSFITEDGLTVCDECVNKCLDCGTYVIKGNSDGVRYPNEMVMNIDEKILIINKNSYGNDYCKCCTTKNLIQFTLNDITSNLPRELVYEITSYLK